MGWNGRTALSRSVSRVQADLRADPVLKYLLVLTFTLAAFFLWYRTPNVVRSDEFSRLIDAMVAMNYVLADPSLGALQNGVTHGRAFGASFYLSALALLPAYLGAIATGQLGVIVSANTLRSRWDVWMSLPEWFWTTSLLTGRLLVVLFALGCVYLTYRIGETIRDRTAGRLAGLLLALSFSFLRSAHEFAEDVPALFFLLCAFYLVLRYTETGNRTVFLAGCAAGGIAIAFKLTAGVVVFLIGTAYLMRARSVRTTGGDVFTALAPSLFAGGLVVGIGAVFVGFPSVLTAGIDPLVERTVRGTTGKSTAGGAGSAPIVRQLVRKYIGGLGIPLAVAAAGSIVASVSRLRAHRPEANGVALTLTALSIYLLVFAQWGEIKPHHLLPTFPLLAILVAVVFSQLDAHWSLLARPLIGILIVTTGIYAGVGVLGYASGADGAPERWIATEMPADATMDVYVPRFQGAAPLHGQPVGHYVSPEIDTYDRMKGEGWAPEGFREWRYNITERAPEYIQVTASRTPYVPPVAKEQYTVVATFEADWPLRKEARALGGKRSYPEFVPARRVIILERSDRCNQSSTCQ